MKKTISKLLIFLLAIIMTTSCSLFGTGSDSDSASKSDAANSKDNEYSIDEEDDFVQEIDPETGLPLLPEGNGIMFEEEAEGRKIRPKQTNTTQFIGEWEATSDQATYLYGNVDLTIETNYFWKGNITGEDYTGKWKETNDGIVISCDLFTFDLVFDQSGKLIMIEHTEGDAEDYHTVLTRKSIL